MTKPSSLNPTRYQLLRDPRRNKGTSVPTPG
jgi:hypothetical protein